MALSERMFNQFLTTSGSTVAGQGAQGNLNLGLSSGYNRAILGDRQAQAMAVAPALNTIIGRTDAQKRQDAATGNRTGGKLAGQQTTQDTANQAIAAGVMGQQGQAAGQLSQIGEAELQNMLQALNIGTSAAQKDVESRRQATAQMWGALIGGAGDILGGAASAGKLF